MARTPIEACRLTIRGVTVRILADDTGGETENLRDVVAAIQAATRPIAEAIVDRLLAAGAGAAAGGVPATPEDPRDDRAVLDMDGGVSRFRHAAEDVNDEPHAPVEPAAVPRPGTGSADAATSTEEASPASWAIRVAAAREYGQRMSAEVAAGRPAPPALVLPPGLL